MRRLSGWDAMHLQVETDRQYSTVSGIHRLPNDGESRQAAALTLVADVRARVACFPEFRERLHDHPLNPDFPAWRVDPDFDPATNVEHVALRGDRDDRAVCEVEARMLSTHLDRSKPMWRILVVSGHVSGDLFVVWAIHHAAIDAPSGKVMLAAFSQFGDKKIAPLRGIDNPSDFSGADERAFILDGFRRRVVKARRFPGLLARTVRMLFSWKRLNRGEGGLPGLFSGPRTSLNTTLSGQLGYAFGELPLTEVRQVCAETGTTVNDVLLTLVGKGLVDELHRRDESVSSNLTAMCPNEMPEGSDAAKYVTSGTNVVSAINTSLCTTVEDPLERLRAVHVEMEKNKTHHARLGANWNRAWCEYGSQWLVNGAVRLAEATRVADRTRPIYTVLVANVNGGPPATFLGRKESRLYPSGPVYSGSAFNVTAYTTGDVIGLGVTCDATVIDDPFRIVASMTRELSDLTAQVDHRLTHA